MKLADISMRYRTVTLFTAGILAIGGIWAYSRLGKLEMPEFTIKTALVLTPYPGASAREVEQEVTDTIEIAVQQIPELEKVESISRPGLSMLKVYIEESHKAGEMPQIWDMLRRKVSDVQKDLPPGSGPSQVKDDFGDVYGVLLAVTGDGYSHAELKDYTKALKRELLLVEGVARIETWGEQTESVYVELSQSKLADLGVSMDQVLATLRRQNMVVDSGSIEIGRERIRLAPTGAFQSLQEIGNLVIRGYPSEQLVALRDVATIKRGYFQPPRQIMRYNGEPAIGIAISTVTGGNVVEMGQAVRVRLRELMADLPVGIDVGLVAYQSDRVSNAVNTFMTNLIEAVVIVLVLLLVFMGIRSGILIGAGLLLTILATLVGMKLWGIDLQRVSLGSLIIALGMLVDNAIVVTDGILVKLQRGMERFEAAQKTVQETALPLLGATLIAIFAFLAVHLSQDNVGEFCESLFQVLAMSLMVSWVLAMTVTPVCCQIWLKVSSRQQRRDPYAGIAFRTYRGLLNRALHHRSTTIGVMLALLVASIGGFVFVRRSFFPPSDRPQFRVDYWLPEGSRIQSTSQDLKTVEHCILEHPAIESIGTFIGSGPPRFYLPVEPELPAACYAQIVVNVRRTSEVDTAIAHVREQFGSRFADGEVRIRKFPLGPENQFEIEARFRGPDPLVLRGLADKAKAIMFAEPVAQSVRDDWRQHVKEVVPVYSQPRARRAGVSRDEIAMSLKRAFDGLAVGIYRENDELLPIIVRAPAEERARVGNLDLLPVWGQIYPKSIPLGQVVSKINTEWEPALIRRLNRLPCITVQCDPVQHNAEEVLARLRPKISSIGLPSGYELQWGGQYEKSAKAEGNVFRHVPISILLMVFITVALFNAFRQPLIIFLTVPLAIIGVAAGLLVTRQPFGFLAIVGALSLIGMLIKNAVVLIDQTDTEIRSGKDRYASVLDASVSRLRPVLMASLTTVLGMSPLLFDALFAPMAVTIMFGLTFATVLTLIVVPVLYVLLFRIEPASE